MTVLFFLIVPRISFGRVRSLCDNETSRLAYVPADGGPARPGMTASVLQYGRLETIVHSELTFSDLLCILRLMV
ncbi:hypothetical protein BAUCODRAFT_278340 [Baudoinia panamericana UAMH 10762]|uniref:Secreted protein n=1 Tax=Baudoinia panamericana (strain UAMH 10762) TaxID=717646 RepID=M2LDV3_BAUPA|nr:uncharacterized protein BAUCODRAFT_278340 [Baudoinia panamericana UAMH 10762]EMC92162.1 hypothetical protein BAUCODRAFT_278340 [Baudoinia panamericana UAMH 10762]